MQNWLKSVCFFNSVAVLLSLFLGCHKETAPAPPPAEQTVEVTETPHHDGGGAAEKPRATPTPSGAPKKHHHHKAGPAPPAVEPSASPKVSASPVTLPTFFPPKATATVELRIIPASEGITLAEFSARISEAMNDAGYEQRSYFWLDKEHAPSFAIITHVEQIRPDGAPVSNRRWSFELPSYETFSIATFLKALIKADPGNYRLIALVVSKIPFEEKKESITPGQVAELNQGPKFLSETADSNTIVTGDYHCIAYIYEFERKTRNDEPVFKEMSGISASAHLQSTPLWQRLTKLH